MSAQSAELINGDVSFWVRDAGWPTPRAPLPGPIDVDVAIVGGGMTGLWTAYYLKQEQPDWEIAIIEREFCGFGASGRNGGWMSAEPAGPFRRYAADRGRDAALAMQQEMFGAVRESVDVARREGFGDSVDETGLIHVATSRAGLARAYHHVEEMKQQGWGEDDVHTLTASELNQRVNVNRGMGGYSTPHCARVHPAKYTFGLAAAVERLGVRIYEQTTATALKPHTVVTDRGEVSARVVVRALEGYTASLPGERRTLLPMNSSLVITEPLTDQQLATIGWGGAELLGDTAHSFSYLQLTADHRIAIGGRGKPYDFGSNFDRRGRTAEFGVDLIRERLTQLFPSLQGIGLEQTWTGVLGVPRDWSAAVNYDAGTGLASAGGYVGHGLSGTNLAGRTLRDLILGRDTKLARLPWTGRKARRWEFEPLRWIGATGLYAAYRWADQREDRSESSETSAVAKIADRIAGR
ncbi:FAD-binding oxidoreductase [Zhihengliuella alba]|uniref:FAD-binding oxidoreductase n=1 Tax=Zhihengliuella alba TaxID=547018 RepID=A0ABP7DPP0_9MICC